MTAALGTTPLPAPTLRRPTTATLLFDQVRFATRELWRSRIVLVFAFVLPLAWLIMIGIIAGNDAVDAVSGVRVMQFVTPVAVVMGVLLSTYPQVANSLASAREQKIVKRLRGTPLPMWLFLAGRVGAATLLAAAAIVVMLGLAIAAYDVQLIGRTLPATVVTLVVGTASFTALGLAVGALASSGSAAQTFAVASAVIVLFLSGLFSVGSAPPEILTTIGNFFPVHQVLGPLQSQFNPFLTSDGWDLGALAYVAAWGIGGLIVAAWALRREPATHAAVAVQPARLATTSLPVNDAGRPSLLRVIGDQTAWANRYALRYPSSLFFAMGMPAGLFALMSLMYGNSGFRPFGMPFAFFFATAMAVYGISVTAFINMPEAVARARDRGLLKRLRGTPVAGWQYLAGRTVSVLWIGLLTALLVYAIGIGFFGVQVALGGVPLAVLILLLGTLTIAACGYALASVTPNARAAAFVGLAILLPLSFFSDVFVLGNSMPEWMGQVGSFFPLRHFVHALAAALAPDGASVDWVNFAVMGAWLVIASIVSVRRFRWEPSR